MPGNPAAYEPVVSGEEAAAILSLPRLQQKRMLTLLFRLAERPDQPGDYSTRGDLNRPLNHLRVSNWRVSFWADHAVREFRVGGYHAAVT